MRRLLPLLLLCGLLVGGLPVGGLHAPTPVRTGTPVKAAATVTDWQPTFPINVTNFYAVGADSPYRVHPAKANYRDVDVIAKQVADMQYAGQQVGAYSWLGRGSFPDTAFGNALRAADGTSFRWAIYYELEGPAGLNHGNPTPAQIKVDLDYLYSRYGHDKNYLRIGGKPVIFVYHDVADRCGPSSRWAQADSAHRFYVVQHWVPGYQGCRPVPQSWHIYAPAAGHTQIGTSGYAVSPGYYAYRDASPKLARSVSRFTADLKAMKASRVQWRMTTTWNEWSEGTGVENSSEWRSRSGHGAYVDAMHAVLGSARNTPATPAIVTATTSGRHVVLSWSRSAGATSYDVYRGGCKVATVTSPTWTDTSLADTSASYVVKATNALGTGRSGMTAVGIAGTPSPAPVSSGDGLVAVPAQRIVSTTTGVGVGCGGRRVGQFDVTLPASVPADATSVMLGVTTYASWGNGNVQLFPSGGAVPPVYVVRYVPDSVTSTSSTVPIGKARQISVRINGAMTNVELDLLGYTHPGAGGLTAYTSRRLADTASGFGGVPKGAITGTITTTLPSWVPADVTAVQLKVRVHGASAQGNLVAFPGGTPVPDANSMSYGAVGLLADSVLVPVNAGRTISVHVTTATYVQLGMDGWVTPGSTSLVTVGTPTRILTSISQVGDTALTLPAASAGHVVLLSVTIAHGASTSLASVYPNGAATPELATIAFGALQPMSSLVWVKVPANRVVQVQMRAAGMLFVDQLAVA